MNFGKCHCVTHGGFLLIMLPSLADQTSEDTGQIELSSWHVLHRASFRFRSTHHQSVLQQGVFACHAVEHAIHPFPFPTTLSSLVTCGCFQL